MEEFKRTKCAMASQAQPDVSAAVQDMPPPDRNRTTLEGGSSVTALTGTLCNTLLRSSLEGESCVTTQTGTLCNTVLQPNWEGEQCVYAQTGSQSNIINEQPTVYTTDEEEFCDGGGTIMMMQTDYETDEEEFMREECRNTSPAVLVTGPALVHAREPDKTRNTAKRELLAARNMKKGSATAQGYNLAYFNLWWSRIGVEGRKEAKEQRRKEEEAGRLRSRLKFTNSEMQKIQNVSLDVSIPVFRYQSILC